MKVIEETIGGASVLIQAVDDKMEIIGSEPKGRATQPTGIEDKVQDAYSQVRSVIKGIAENIGADLAEIQDTARPKRIQMDFSISISAQYGAALILGGKGEAGITVSIIWEVVENEKTD